MITQGERRNFIRMAVKAEVSIKRLDGSKLVGKSHNLSATGLSVALSEALNLDEQVDIFIDSSGEGIRPLEASAKVVRVDAIDNEQFSIGLTITDFK